MTKQEAIEVLKGIVEEASESKEAVCYVSADEDIDALNMAIKALEQEPCKVVRCRECEYWKCNPNTKNYGVCGKVSYDDFEVIMEGDDFCSFGIRMK